ncbi:MAG: NADP-dependent oxidoreductase [Chloroflexia bacterium]
MKAARLNEWGQPLQVEDVPQPTPGSDEVLVRIRAASINPFDRAVAAGYMQGMFATPMTMGTDFAGDVIGTGENVQHVKPGDEVFGLVTFGDGTFAEYAIAKSNEVAPKPKSMDYIQAGAVPLAALAAWQSLFDAAQLKPGERLFVHGVGGSVGMFACQFAQDIGAEVIGSCIPEKAAHVAGLGLSRSIDYQDQLFEEVVSDVDVVLDLVGGDTVQRSFAMLKPGGRVVTILGGPTPEEQEEAERRGVKAIGTYVQPTAEHLTRVADMIDADKIKVFVRDTFPLEEAQAAFESSMQRGKTGKVVITVA